MVPHMFLDHLSVHTRLEEVRGVTVSQVVESDRGTLARPMTFRKSRWVMFLEWSGFPFGWQKISPWSLYLFPRRALAFPWLSRRL